MNSLLFGDVVRVAFPFADSEGRKERPAVVVSSAPYHQYRPDILVVALSTRLIANIEIGEFVLSDWQGVGLEKSSRVKAVVATIKSDRILSRLGVLNDADQRQLRSMLQNIMG